MERDAAGEARSLVKARGPTMKGRGGAERARDLPALPERDRLQAPTSPRRWRCRGWWPNTDAAPASSRVATQIVQPVRRQSAGADRDERRAAPRTASARPRPAQPAPAAVKPIGGFSLIFSVLLAEPAALGARVEFLPGSCDLHPEVPGRQAFEVPVRWLFAVHEACWRSHPSS